MFHSGLSWSCVFILAFYVDMKELVLGSIRQAPMRTEKSVVSAKASLPSYSRKEAAIVLLVFHTIPSPTPTVCWTSPFCTYILTWSMYYWHASIFCLTQLNQFPASFCLSSIGTLPHILCGGRAVSLVLLCLPPAFPVHLQNTMASLWKCRRFPAVFRHPETGLSLARAGILRPEARLQRLPLHPIQHLLS